MICRSMVMRLTMPWLLVTAAVYIAVCDGAIASNAYLDENSVVLITGAAGFIGSELAMALYRTYQPKKIICVDSMDAGFGTVSKSEPDLALFEFKRQRVFHMLQTVDPASIYFYRVDFRPSIPEYFDSSEIPVLHHIFEEHSDITHVVHLADHVHHAEKETRTTVIPRVKGQEKAGLMESMLEELLLQRVTRSNTTEFIVPLHFVYASSAAVYNYYASNHNDRSPNPPPFAENKPLTTPSTAAGAQKMIDEILAQAYFDVHGISSTGLRLFNVYGPWGLPGSAIFEMAERTVAGEDPAAAVASDALDNIADYIYIDDAIDAIMAAMQLMTEQAIAINIGTGKGTSLRTIADKMRQLMPKAKNTRGDSQEQPASTASYADMTRATTLLGFQPHVTLERGVEKLLAWHYDRSFPYGSGVEKGIATCARYDTECLKGTPVFPCASECSHPSQCKRSLFDDVLDLTRAITAKCSTVMYTVVLGRNVTHISSTNVRVSTQSVAFVNDSAGSHCNLAFVSDSSPLYQKRDITAADGIVMHGFWSLIPVAVTKFSDDKIKLLSLLPKLSPGNFFADSVEKAIYCDSDVIFDSIPRLIQESNMQPKHPNVRGATVMLLGKKAVDATALHRTLMVTTEKTPPNQLVQDSTYRMIRMAVIDEMAGDGFAQKIDAGFLVHNLRGPNDSDDDARIFRCDVFGEVVQWQVDTDLAAFEFILGLHDMWSRVMVKKSGLEPWWIGDDVATVSSSVSRRLQAVDDKQDDEKALLEGDGEIEHDGEMPVHDDATVDKRLLTVEENLDEDDENTIADEVQKEGPIVPEAAEHNGFGVARAIEAVFGYSKQKQQKRFDRPEDEEADDFVVDDDDASEMNPLRGGNGGNAAGDTSPYYLPNADQDPSSYDVWMGVLSSSPVRYFCRVVDMEAVGVYRITEDYSGVVSSV